MLILRLGEIASSEKDVQMFFIESGKVCILHKQSYTYIAELVVRLVWLTVFVVHAAIARDKDVLRLHVAVHDALVVRGS